MQWRLRIGRFRGIDVFVHATFLLLLGWIAFSSYQQSGTVEGVLAGLALITTVFTIVVMHEFGHALMAQRFGVGTRDITLYPIGGVARLERIPEKPAHELVIAIAGPAVNIALAILIGLVLVTFGVPLLPELDPERITATFADIPVRLFWVNIMLALFNLLPAFPMDGGRVLRALLAMRLDHRVATETAAAIGRLLAVGLGLFGVLYSPMLVLIALFVWMAGGAEASAVEARSVLRDLPVRAAMLRDQRTLDVDATLDDAVRLLIEGTQTEFPIERAGSLVGVLTRSRLIEGLAQHGKEGRVGDVMQTEVTKVDADEMLELALERIEANPTRTAFVMQGGALIGMLTMENLGELLMVEGALRRRTERIRTPKTPL